MCKFLRAKRNQKSGFSLVEVMIAMGVASMGILGTLSLIMFAQTHNALEMERSRAHQIVSQTMEQAEFSLFTVLQTGTTTTIWDNGTPLDTTDDTVGSLSVIARNVMNGTTITLTPPSATALQVEVTLTWNPRGAMGTKTFRETAMTIIAP